MDIVKRVTEGNLKGQESEDQKNRKNAEGNVYAVSAMSLPRCQALCLCDCYSAVTITFCNSVYFTDG